MKVDQDWTNVWPTAHSFKWSVVPFPVRQGHVKVSVTLYVYISLIFSTFILFVTC